MKFEHSVAVAGLALACALTLTPALGAQQAGRGTASKTPQQTHMMAMPGMNDAQFVQMMTKHHQDGIEMSKLEESKGTRAEVKALATKIREGQEREIKELEAAKPHDSHAGAPVPQGTSGHASHDAMQKHHEMMEEMAAMSRKKIDDATGAAVDEAFLEEMAVHHPMALQMVAKTTFKDAELKKVAQKMAADQKRDLAELKKLQAR